MNMKQNITYLFAILLILSSCKKSYKYVEVVEEKGLLGGASQIKEKSPKIISAENDSIAYLEAYEDFCISLKVNKDMQESMENTYSTPIRFKLLNYNNEDIAPLVSITDKTKREDDIKNKIFSLPNNLKDAIDKGKQENAGNFKKTASIDSVKSKSLQKYFRVRKDEFSNTNKKWYEPANAPKYTNMNGIYCYFQTENNIPSNLRFRVQYHADDWLFISRIQFSIDGKAYDYIPSDVETDSGNGGRIWEWFDESLDSSDKELIDALANAKSAKMKLIGKQYHDIKAITTEQINSIKRTLEMYNAMGGNY
jgi:hypothetical protein